MVYWKIVSWGLAETAAGLMCPFYYVFSILMLTGFSVLSAGKYLQIFFPTYMLRE